MQPIEIFPYIMGIIVPVLFVAGWVSLARDTTVEGFRLKAFGFTLETRKLTTRTRHKE